MATAAVGIAGTVEPLVVPAGERHQGPEAGCGGEPPGADDGVLHNVRALDDRKRTGGFEDCLGHVELADVVHQRTPVDQADLVLRQVRELCDAYRELGDAPRVRERIGAPALELRDDK